MAEEEKTEFAISNLPPWERNEEVQVSLSIFWRRGKKSWILGFVVSRGGLDM
jgi:hypothetical protein